MSSCSGDNADADSFSADQLKAGAVIDVSGRGAEGIVIPVQTNCTWTVQTDASWLHITSPKAGQGQGSEDVVLDIDASRLPNSQMGHLTIITQAGVKRIITVTQRAGDVRLLAAPGSFFFTCEGGEQVLEITSNTQWTASCSTKWLTVNGEQELTADGNQRLTILATPNTLADGLQGSIVFRDVDNMVEPVTVDVAVGGRTPQLTITPPNNVAAVGGRTAVSIRSNFNWEAALTGMNPVGTTQWARFSAGGQIVTGNAGAEVHELEIYVEPNTTEQERTFMLQVKTLSGMGQDTERTLLVTQEAGTRPVVYEPACSSITMNGCLVTFAATTATLDIMECGVLYSTEADQLLSGIRLTTTSQGTDHTITLSDLTAGTTYYLCAFATNSVGTSYSRVISFKTRSTPKRDGNETP